MPAFNCIIVGNESLVIQCGEMLRDAGHTVKAVVTKNDDVRGWAKANEIAAFDNNSDLAEKLESLSFDWLFSVANLDIIPQSVLDQASSGAVNFHDGPLPTYAGVNVPVWALMNGETQHGVTWHMISDGIDEGDILNQQIFDITEGETAFTLNAKCYAAAIDGFGDVIAELASGSPSVSKQDLSDRTYFSKNQRPAAAGRLDFSRSAKDLVAEVRALDHGGYWNPLYCPKIEFGDQVFTVGSAEPSDESINAAPGTVISNSDGALTVTTGTTPIILSGFLTGDAKPIDAKDIAQPDDLLPSLTPQESDDLTTAMAKTTRAENHWRSRLETLNAARLALVETSAASSEQSRRDLVTGGNVTSDEIATALAMLTARLSDQSCVDLAWHDENTRNGTSAHYINNWVPIRFELGVDFNESHAAFNAEMADAQKSGGFAADLIARIPGQIDFTTPQIGITSDTDGGLIPGTSLTLAISDDTTTLIADTGRIAEQYLEILAARLETLVAAVASDAGRSSPSTNLPILPEAERDQVLHEWNDTKINFDFSACVHQYFEAQAERTPDATAVVFESETLSYRELNAQANQAAQVLRSMGVGPGSLVGLYTSRSATLLIGALAILKAGGAYVPLDPTYPANRITLYIDDSKTSVIVTEAALVDDLPDHAAEVLVLDTDLRIGLAAADTPDSGVTPDDLAYLIYTSGSTGKPKGVMVEHRNVSNFFTGMDDRVEQDENGVWLAVTSLSFDISVLELFYSLSRGFKLVINSDESRLRMSNGQIAATDRGMEFSLFFWGNDDGVGRDKYKLLLEGAKFADKNGFTAVWTPERHFHAFGGPYPNPSVTGAAVAAITENLSVRAGSCVVPLHHTARVAEEWAVIDNLTNGRAGLAVASGWQPNDFVLRPENSPPNNKTAMFDSVRDLRKLWAGEAVEFPTQSGEPFAVVTQPRPVSKELPIWVTIAGNPDTWREAGEIGAHVLTHLLGQSIADVADRIKIYHDALRSSGYDPADHKITLMLHSFVGRDIDTVRETARGPMKEYMGAAAGLIKQCAWDFPAFKKPKGVTNPFEIDLETLSAEELDAILEFAFARYFDESGLFGTVDDCLKRVEDLKRIGIDEIACLIDYGIPVPKVLEGLFPLAEVLRRANEESTLEEDDFSLAAQIVRHDVTHLQCTPSMARMIVSDEESRQTLGRVDQLMLGGEALPGTLVDGLSKATDARIENMYGPTETTIWSSTETVDAPEGTMNIGHPIANTMMYVLNDAHEPVPIGVAGELFIGGEGVARGYWQNNEQTAAAFLPDPFRKNGEGRMYRTGDLVRRRLDGKLDFLGRVDHQVKIRGHRTELGEIETALEAIPAITQAVVTVREDTPGDKRLVAYLRSDGALADDQLRDILSVKLLDHMVPSQFVTLTEFPLTPNMKVDRAALPAMAEIATPMQSDTFEEPANQTEKQVAEIWKKVLGINSVGSKDSFFNLGGHSLLAVQAHREIREKLGLKRLSITDVFRFPTLAAFAGHLDEQSGGGKKPDPIEEKAAEETAQTRSDVMAKRRAMRTNRVSQT